MALALGLAIFVVLAPLADAVISTVPLGCFFHGWRFDGLVKGVRNHVNASSAEECQELCAAVAGCKSFGYSAHWQTCYFGNQFKTPVPAIDKTFVVGPARCKVDGRFDTGMEAGALCSESALPGSGFPGKTAEESEAAWTTGIAPVNLQCWPHYQNGDLAPCKGEEIKVLEDTATGWPGDCLGLSLVQTLGRSCESSCRNNVSCASWQEVKVGAVLECWQGVGYDCYKRRKKTQITKAQRFQRGHSRVLKDLRGWEVTGLTYAFGSEMFGSDIDKAIGACRHTCLSDLRCQLWSYSTGDGCWFEDSRHGAVNYPMTTSDLATGTKASKLVVAGQYLQRLCTIPQDLSMPSTTTFPPVPPPVVPVPTAPVPEAPAHDAVSAPTLPKPTVVKDTKKIPASRFVKDVAGKIFYLDSKTATKNEVKQGCANWRCSVPNTQCVEAIIVKEVFLDEIKAGSDFICEMLPGGKLASEPVVLVPDEPSGRSAESGTAGLDQPGEGKSSNSFWWWLGRGICVLFAILVCISCAALLPWMTDGKYSVPCCGWVTACMPSWTGKGRDFKRLRGVELNKYEQYEQAPTTSYAAGNSYTPTQQTAQQTTYNASYSTAFPQMQTQYQYVPQAQQDPMYDLVTVTAQGLQVTPLGGGNVPQGVPLVDPSLAGSSFASQGFR
eukprot:TRINITY_DN12695_c0_g1_i2.p1 TRINITY_DN12695_c0_g1~~TRINITY_DN12695_c0_g1_i2.p1  ORF type:complete len:666 (+),score=73.72 TRINITY_DN12695_c0_g1_i2:80-2077(+)